MKCLKCGKEVSYGASFCDHCGNIINYNESNPYSKVTTNKTNPTALIIVVIVIIFFITFIFGFIMASNQLSVVKTNLRYTYPDSNIKEIMSDAVKSIHTIITDNNTYNIEINKVETESDEIKYINSLILNDSSYIDNINKVTLNSKDWFHYSKIKTSSYEYYYVIKENDTLFEVKFICENNNTECEEYKNKFINTLEIY